MCEYQSFSTNSEDSLEKNDLWQLVVFKLRKLYPLFFTTNCEFEEKKNITSFRKITPPFGDTR